MTTTILGTFLVLLIPAAVFAAVSFLIHWQFAKLRAQSSRGSDWSQDFSVDRYRPMFRLLDEADIRFLRSQPGATPALIKQLRRQRCRVFHNYLTSLEHDFATASAALTMVMIQSQSDRRDILRALIVSRVQFAIGLFRVRCRLRLYRWEVETESIARLVRLFEGLQLELLALAPSPEPATAELRLS